MNRDELGRLMEEQAALRRVAMLVVHGAPPAEVFSAVAGEMGRIMDAEYTYISRFQPDNTMVVVASWKRSDAVADRVPAIGSVWSLELDSAGAWVARTERPARIEYDECVTGLGWWARTRGSRSGLGCPIKVEGRLWGVVTVLSTQPHGWPAGIEERMLGFMEMLGAAVANAESRDELAASRARVVAAADATYRRIERDLHDGVQQRLIACGLLLRDAQANLPPGSEELGKQLSVASECLRDVLDELREISHGLHPAILSRGGIGPALKALARRSAIRVELHVREGLRLPEAVEVAVYYIVSEALTNVAKHAHTSLARVDLSVAGSAVRVSVRDEGVGGADFGRGSGLIGLKDRVEALGGTIEIVSPPDGGTSLFAEIPTRPVGSAPDRLRPPTIGEVT
jgi:signal transduction histidine kinase